MAAGLDCLSEKGGWLIAELNKILTARHAAESARAVIRQRELARLEGTNRRALNGLGAPAFQVDSYSYHYWGQRLGYKCWKDKGFVREFLRDNPEARIKSTGTRPQVGASGIQAAPSFARWRKSYGAL